MLCVSSSVLAPSLADASAASVPAWPPPTTITSNRVSKIMIYMSIFAFARAAGTTRRRDESYDKRPPPERLEQPDEAGFT